MFSGWDNYYIIIGPSAGALLGIMFVVATLTAGLESNRASQGSQIYITPNVFHFAIVVVVSAITAVPNLAPEAAGAGIALCAAAGLFYSTRTAMRVFRVTLDQPPDWEDKIFYGLLPVVTYLGLAGSAAAVWLAPASAAHAIGATMLFLLLVGIRNAWDLATYLVQHRP